MNLRIAPVLRKIAAATTLALGVASGAAALSTGAAAHPLDASWTQIGLAQPDGGLFDGNCNLRNTCSFNNGGDYWNAFASASEILFITGDRKFWGQAAYATVLGLVNAAAGVFGPNLTWIDAGRDGASIGAVTGNLLQRDIYSEDPWITLQGSHCASACSEILWGENDFKAAHAGLSTAHGGIEVYVRGGAVSAQAIPEPGSLALAGLMLAGLARSRRLLS